MPLPPLTQFNPALPRSVIAVIQKALAKLPAERFRTTLEFFNAFERAWIDFAGWRVNYDRILLALCALVMAPETPWSSDRAPQFKAKLGLLIEK
jgi:hypothetical protein